jgi:hypothetical protein
VRSLDQRRAAAAYAGIGEAKKDVVVLARKLPDMLRTNGLLATWAFLLSKELKDKPTPTPLPIVLAHLRSRPDLEVPESGDTRAAFLHWVGGPAGAAGGVDGPELRALTAEALAFAGWLKRAAEARGDVAEGEGAADA